MSTAVSPTNATPQFTTDELTVIVASLSCLIFFLVIMVLLCLLYRRDPLCCKVRQYQDSHTDLATPPQYYSSTQTLVGPPCSHQNLSRENTHRQSDSLFLIGLPSSYGLPSLAVPRLPSYESVRKKDRQRQIHMMIADRFGLNGPYISEPPPSYEESLRQSVEIPRGVIGPLHDPSNVVGSSEVSCDMTGPFHGPSDMTGPLEAPSDVIGPLEAACDVIGPSEVACDVNFPPNPSFDVTGPLEAHCDMIGPLPANCDGIGSSNAPPHVIGPNGVLLPATPVSDLFEAHTHTHICPV